MIARVLQSSLAHCKFNTFVIRDFTNLNFVTRLERGRQLLVVVKATYFMLHLYSDLYRFISITKKQ